MNKTRFITNVFIMTLSMLVIRMVSMSFNIYISGKIGGAQTGLFQLVFSVYSFGITFSTSGISIAVTRLISEQIGKYKRRGVEHILNKCIVLSLLFSIAAAVVLFFSSSFIAHQMIGDERATIMLKILAFALPPLAVSVTLRGYFIGLKKVVIATASQLTEEFSGIFITFLLLPGCIKSGNPCLAIIIGSAISEYMSCTYDLLTYAITKRKYRSESVQKKAGFKDILNISVPIALGSYLRSGLTSLENLLIPLQFAKSGIPDSLAKYGIIKGMSMQVISFPYVFLQSFISLIIPEIAERNASGKNKSVKNATLKSIEYTICFGMIIFAVLYIYHDKLSLMTYKSMEVGTYIYMLSFLCVPMYVDSVVDGMLKALNQQVSSLKYNIADSFLRVASIYFIVPKFGIISYIGILYASEFLNLSLSLGRLITVTKIKINIINTLISPAICVLLAYILTRILCNIILMGFVAEISLFVGVYVVFIVITKKLTD